MQANVSDTWSLLLTAAGAVCVAAPFLWEWWPLLAKISNCCWHEAIMSANQAMIPALLPPRTRLHGLPHGRLRWRLLGSEEPCH